MHSILNQVTGWGSHWVFWVGLSMFALSWSNALYQSTMAYFLVLRPSNIGERRSNYVTILKMAAPLAGKVIIFACGIAIGYLARENRLYAATNHMQNVDVVRRYDAHHYRILSEDVLRSYDIELCPNDLAPNWEEGTVLSDFVYEKLSSCLRLQWFRQARDLSTGRLLQSKEMNNP